MLRTESLSDLINEIEDSAAINIIVAESHIEQLKNMTAQLEQVKERYVSIRSNDINKEEERKIKRDLLALRAIIGRYNRWMY